MRERWLMARERWVWETEQGKLALVALQQAPVRRKDSHREARIKASTLLGEWHVRAPKVTLWTPPGGGLRVAA